MQNRYSNQKAHNRLRYKEIYRAAYSLQIHDACNEESSISVGVESLFNAVGFFTLLQSEFVTRMHTAKSICISIPWNITQPSITFYSDSASVKRSFPFLLPRLMCQQYTAITIAETRCRREGKEIKTKTIKTKAKAKGKSLSTWCMYVLRWPLYYNSLRTLDFGGP